MPRSAAEIPLLWTFFSTARATTASRVRWLSSSSRCSGAASIERAAGRECCSRCGRTPLLGERVYTLDEGGTWVCELCRAVGGGQALGSRVVHGPAFGHSIRIVDQRAA